MNLFPGEECSSPRWNYECGDEIPQSGIYEACHTGGKVQTTLLFRGQTFPPCECCNTEVKYRLVRAVPHVFEDEDFKQQP